MKLAATFAFLALGMASASAQIVTMTPTVPPCTGEHCLNPERGARITHHGAPSAEKAACPAGTVYNARKGTCRVLPP